MNIFNLKFEIAAFIRLIDILERGYYYPSKVTKMSVTNEDFKVDPTLEYVNRIVNGTDNDDEDDEFQVSITNSPTTPHPAYGSCSPTIAVRYVLEQRMERLEKMVCATFDAVRQVSHQIYS